MYKDTEFFTRILESATKTFRKIPLRWMKTATYCAMHFTVAIMVAFALTRNIRAALAIGIVEPLVQTFFFNQHDRIWSKVERKHRESQQTKTVA